jgi:hypothetical protein
MGGGGQQMMGQIGQAVQNNVPQGSPTSAYAPTAPAGNAYTAPVALPAQLPGNYQDNRMRSPQEQQPFPQQQSSWQQNPEWQGYQTQMQDLQKKMQTYQQQYQPQQQNQQYQPRGRGGYGGFRQSQNSGLAGLLGGLGLGGGFGGGYGGGGFNSNNSYDPYMNMPDFGSGSPSYGQGLGYNNGGKVE